MKRLWILAVLSVPLCAQVQSIQAGLWSSPATWNGGVVPGNANEEVIITQPVFLDTNLTSVHNIRVMRDHLQINSASITGCAPQCVANFVTLAQNPRLVVGARVTVTGFNNANLTCINSTTPVTVLTNADTTHFTINANGCTTTSVSISNVGSADEYGHLCSYDGTHASTEADCVYDRAAAHSILFNSTGTANTGTGTGTAGNPDSGATMFGFLIVDRSPDGYDTVHLSGSSTINLTIDTVNQTNRWYMIAANTSGYSGGCATLGTAGCTGGQGGNNARGPSTTFSGVISNRQGNPTTTAQNVFDGIYFDEGSLWTTKPVLMLAHNHFYQFGKINVVSPQSGIANGFTVSYNWFDDPKVAFTCGASGNITPICVSTGVPASGNINIDHNTMTAGPDTVTYTYLYYAISPFTNGNWSNNVAIGFSDGTIQVGVMLISSADQPTATGGNTISNNVVLNAEGTVSGMPAGLQWPCTTGDTTTIIKNNVILGTNNPLLLAYFGPCGLTTNNYLTEWLEASGGQMLLRGYTTLSTLGCAIYRNNVVTLENTSSNVILLPYSVDTSANSCFYIDNNTFVNFTPSGLDGTLGLGMGDAGTPSHARSQATVNSTYTNNILDYFGTGTTTTATGTNGIGSMADNNTWLTTKCTAGVGVCNNLTLLRNGSGIWSNYRMCDSAICVPNPTGGPGYDNGTIRHPNALYGDLDQVIPGYFDPSRHGVPGIVNNYDQYVCGGPGTWADLQAQFANRWNGTNKPCADGLALNQWILAGYKPYNNQLKGGGNGGLDIGAIPVFPAAIIE